MRPVIRGSGVMAVGGGAGSGVVQAPVGHGHPAGLWRTPTPYLFLGFAAMMVLIAVALLVLVCTHRKPSRRQGSAADDEEAAAAAARTTTPLDREPKVVVIMAGDHLPSFLASARPFAAPAAAEPPMADAA